MSLELIIAIIGAITTILGTMLGNIQGKKKSNAEAGLMQVQTLEEIRKFYQTTIMSQTEIVSRRDERIAALEAELALYKQKVDMLQQIVSRYMSKRYSDDVGFSPQEVAEILNFNTEVKPIKEETGEREED